MAFLKTAFKALNQADDYLQTTYDNYQKKLLPKPEDTLIWWQGSYVKLKDIKSTFRDNQSIPTADSSDVITTAIKKIRSIELPTDTYVFHNSNVRLTLSQKSLNNETTYKNPNYINNKLTDEVLFLPAQKTEPKKLSLFENPKVQDNKQDLKNIYENPKVQDNKQDLKNIYENPKVQDNKQDLKNIYENPKVQDNKQDLKNIFDNTKYQIKTPGNETILTNPIIQNKKVSLGDMNFNITKNVERKLEDVYTQPKNNTKNIEKTSIFENPQRRNITDLGNILTNPIIKKGDIKPLDNIFTNPEKKENINLGNVYNNEDKKQKIPNFSEENNVINQKIIKQQQKVDLGNLFDSNVQKNTEEEVKKLRKMEEKQSGR